MFRSRKMNALHLRFLGLDATSFGRAGLGIWVPTFLLPGAQDAEVEGGLLFGTI